MAIDRFDIPPPPKPKGAQWELDPQELSKWFDRLYLYLTKGVSDVNISDSNGNPIIAVDGALTTVEQSIGLAIAKGDVAGVMPVHKSGVALDFDTSDGFVNVWEGAEDATSWTLMQYVYSTTADIDSISSSSPVDIEPIKVIGLDYKWELVEQEVTLDGQNRVVLPISLVRVFVMRNISAIGLVGEVFCFVDGALTGGIPVANADIRAIIHPANNKTLMCMYTIPAGKTGYLRSWFASTAGGRRDSTHTVRAELRRYGGVFQVEYLTNIELDGDNSSRHDYAEPPRIPEKTDIQIKMNTDVNSAGVAAGFDLVLVDN